MNFTLKVIKNRQVIQTARTHSLRRFCNHLRTINWEDKPLKVYLKVYYGRYEDVWGKLSSFYNDGWYESKEDLWSALDAFRQEGAEME